MPDKYVGSVPYVVGKPWDRAAVELHEFLRKLNFAHNLQVDLNAASISGGNTSGSLAPISSGTIYFSASNNLTLNQSGNSLGIVGPGLISVGVSTGGNTAGTTGLVASRVVLYGGANVSLSQSVSGQSATITWNVHPPIGIAAGTQTATTGTVVFSNSNNVSFGMSGSNTITASVTVAPQTGVSAISAGTTQATSGTVVFSNSNGISFGVNGQTVTASYTVPSVTNSSWTVSAGTTSNTVSQLVFSNSNNVSFGLNAGTITATATVASSAASISASGSNGSFYSNRINFALSNTNITVYTTEDGFGSGAIAFSARQKYLEAGMSTQGNTAGTTGLAPERIIFVGSNNITLSQSADGTNATLSIIGGAGGAGDGYNIIAAGTQTAATTGTVVFSNSNNMTFGMSNSSVVTGSFGFYLSAGTTDTAAVNSLRFVDGGGISFGLNPASRITASVRTDYASSDHSHGNPTLALTNLTGTTASASNGFTLSLSAAAPGGGGGSQSIGMSTQTAGGNTAGTTGYAQGSAIQYLLVPGSNITMSQSVNGSSGTISIYAPTGGGGNTLSYYANIDAFCGTQTMTMLQSTSGMFPFVVPYNVSIGFVRIPVSGSVLAASSTAATTGNSSFSGGHWRTFNMVIYTRGAGASSDSLQSYGSTSAGMSYSIAVSCAANSTQHSYSLRYTLPCSSGTTGFTKDYSSSAASLNFHTSRVTDLTGNKILEIPFATLLTPGQYFLGFGVSSTTSTQRTADLSRAGIAFTHFGVSQINSAWGTFGAATNSSVNIQPGIGSFTTAGGGTAASVELTRLSSRASQNLLYFQLMRVT